MRKISLSWFNFLYVGAFAMGLFYAGAALAEPVGKVTNLNGPLLDHKPGGIVLVLAQNSTFEAGDILESEKNTYARIKFIDESEVVLRPGTQFRIDAFSYNSAKPEEDNSVFSLIKGGLRSVTGLLGKRNKEKFKLTTPVATIGIRGTNFGALFCQNDCGSVPTTSGNTPQNGLYVDVTQGEIVVSNPAGQQVYQAGQFGFVANLNTPPIVIPPEEGVPVTMPLSISKNPPDSPNDDDSVDCVVR
jgi:hypothetical protein